MRHTPSDVTPSDLGDHPEIAVLEILDSALSMARLAIIAANPELTDADPDTVPEDIDVLAAEHVLIAVDTLRRSAATYRGVINTDARRVQLSQPGADDDPF